MKRKHWLCFAIAFMLVSCGCSSEKKLNAEDYKDYICSDTGFCALAVYQKGIRGEINQAYVDGYANNQRVIYRQIKYVPDVQFIHVTTSGLLEQSRRFILQNPDNYVDIWNEWTIDSIDFYYLRLKNPSEQEGPAKKPDKIISTTTDKQCLTEIKAMALDNLSYENAYELKIAPDIIIGELNDIYELRIRVHFKESDIIVWDTKCNSYYSEEDKCRSVKIDMSTEEGRNLLNGYTVSVQMDKDSSLYKWLSEEIDELMVRHV